MKDAKLFGRARATGTTAAATRSQLVAVVRSSARPIDTISRASLTLNRKMVTNPLAASTVKLRSDKIKRKIRI